MTLIYKKNIHFVGIGGIGMSAIAEILHQKGFRISGSDISDSLIIRRLKKNGIIIYRKHSKENLKNIDMVVYSSAIKKNNPELRYAESTKIPTISRALMLAEVMRLKPSVTVAGSHGKTTTTSLIACILESSNLDPTIINGGIINSLKTNAKLGKGQWIVAEADESDGSFVYLPSTIGVITNIDLEHLDFYKDINQIKKAFINYAKNIPFYGFLALCVDDPRVKELKEKLYGKKILTYGFSEKANISAMNIRTFETNNNFCTNFDIVENFEEKKIVKNFSVPLLGKHNVQNILASICVAKGLKISNQKIKNALKNFLGVKRRFTILYRDSSNTIIDDYAHHPREIKATLKALKSITKKKILAVFEPHRFSRIKGLLNDFIKSFNDSDYIFVLPVFSAGEKEINKMDNHHISKLISKKLQKKVLAINDINQLNKNLREYVKPGDNIIFLGAGLSSKIAEKFTKYFKNDCT